MQESRSGCSQVGVMPSSPLSHGDPSPLLCLISPPLLSLLGDKVETAINIAMSCRLFDQSMALVELRERDFEKAIDVESQTLILMTKIDEVAEGEKRREARGFGSNV